MDPLNRPKSQDTTATPAPASPNGAPAPDVPVSFTAWLQGNALGMIVVLGAVAALWYYLSTSRGMTTEEIGEFFWNVAKVAIGLGVVIFLHELGHFAVAKWCDVYVETFSIGFGPPLPGCRFKWGETTYKLAVFPLGGYVKMLGEGEGEGEDEDDDPRSFKNKPVGQRMAIISAGVVMNLISAFLFFVWVYLGHGERRIYGIVGAIEPGSPAWEAGVRSDARFLKIGSTEDPFFDDFSRIAVLSSEGERIPVEYTPADSPRERIKVELEARREKGNLVPMIGMMSGNDLKIIQKRKRAIAPVMPDSAAAAAHPPFEFGDVIVGTTDPEFLKVVTPIRKENDTHLEAHIRAREFRVRMERLAGKEAVVRVRRAGPEGEVVDITVPPAYHQTLGLRMRMGQITAVRNDSPAERAGVHLPDPAGKQHGDIIEQVEVVQGDGTSLRFVPTPQANPPEGGIERELDPARLPWDLKQWAGQTTGKRQVKLTVLRKTDTEQKHVVLTLDWDDERRYDKEEPNQIHSPMSIPALGLAYRIDTAVAMVRPDSPAAKEGIKAGNVIKAVRFQIPGPKPGEWTWNKWRDLESHQWAGVSSDFQAEAGKTLQLRVEQGDDDVIKVIEPVLTAEVDLDWPKADRGLWLKPVDHLQHAEGSFLEAVRLGFNKTYRSVVTMYMNLRSMFTGRISVKNLGGPILIADRAYEFAGQGFYEFLMFLGFISVNLAVVNFLPIPLLDGGHMVLLLYEKLRGKPPSDAAQRVIMIVGILIIAAIFLFVTYQDIMRLIF